MSERAVSYKRHRFPPQVIAQAVWLYFRFPLSLCLVEEMLLERGVKVSYETIRTWAMKFKGAERIAACWAENCQSARKIGSDALSVQLLAHVAPIRRA